MKKTSEVNEFRRGWIVLLACFIGMGASLVSLGAIISPVVVGHVWDSTGNYKIALIIGAILVGLAAIISFFLPKYEL